MLKGSTKIILTNAETGDKEVHESHNLVTNAMDRSINIHAALNWTLNDYILPLATRALGGIMLFDGDLTEDPDNINFPVEAHFVGFGDQTASTSSKWKGSYNAAESGRTPTGYVSVWDFGTSQANGVIKSVARTSRFSGGNPIQNLVARSFPITDYGAPAGDLSSWYPVRYDGEYLYLLKGNSTTHIMRLARIRKPLLCLGVADYSGAAVTMEFVASWDTKICASVPYVSRGEVRYTDVYADDPTFYEDGEDGYIYVTANGFDYSSSIYSPVSGYTYPTLYYFTINYGDGSYEKSALAHTVVGSAGCMYRSGGPIMFGGKFFGHIINGICYRVGADKKTFEIIPLDNPPSYRTVRVIAQDSKDYILQTRMTPPVNGGAFFTVVNDGAKKTYQNGIIYPDGNFILLEPALYDSSKLNLDPLAASQDLSGWWSESGSNYWAIECGWVANYLGTINNLPAAITKTAAQTMKIIYTLTDVDE